MFKQYQFVSGEVGTCRTTARETPGALGGYPNMPEEEDRVKGGDSGASKRACVLFGIGDHPRRPGPGFARPGLDPTVVSSAAI